ncbi:MAG: hypothetical protein ACYDIA_00760 [Candidatus Humimicrobiaceae bacterium]
MEIYSNQFFNIFKANFEYPIVETPIGRAVKMPAKEAFIYSNVTGSGYLENPIYPFTPKGLLKLFYNAFNYKFVSGIFDNGVLKNTPYILSQAKNYLFNENKYIIPIEFESEEKLVSLLKKLFTDLKDSENYIIQRIETNKRGNGMEPFMEYLTAEYFKDLGFIVENQIPLAHAIGSPDFAAYGLSDIIQEIGSYGFLSKEGFHIIELALIRIFKQELNLIDDHKNNNLIVGEVKTGSSFIAKQLEKYLDTGLFDQGFEIHPSKLKPSKDYLGLITLDDNYKVRINSPKSKYLPQKLLSREEYLIWLSNYVKFYLVSNLTNDELKEFYYEKTAKKINNENDLINFILKLKIKNILEKIKSL